MQRLAATDSVIDISGFMASAGEALRRSTSRWLVSLDLSLERLLVPSQAADFTQAALLEALCSCGRPPLEMVAIRSSGVWRDDVIDAALATILEAKEEGLVNLIAIECVGNPLATVANWQFHDAFDLLIVGADLDATSLITLAERRHTPVALRGLRLQGRFGIMSVSTAEQVDAILAGSS